MAKAKSTALKGSEAENIVLAYLKEQNRPYNSTDISLNLNGQVTKPVTQKSLLSLTEKGLILKKEYGKITVFCIKQEEKEVMTSEQLSAIENETKTKKEEMMALKLERKRNQSQLDGLLSTPMNSELDANLLKANSDAEGIHHQLLALQSKGTKLITKDEMALVVKSEIHWRKLWIERRSAFKDLWDQIASQMEPAQRSELQEVIGLDPALDIENEKKYKLSTH